MALQAPCRRVLLHTSCLCVLASVPSTQLPSLEPGCLVLRTQQLRKEPGNPLPYHLAEKRTRPPAFPPDTLLLVVSDLKGQFLPSIREQLFGVVCRFCSKAL